MTQITNRLGFLVGFQRNGSQTESHGDSEDNGEKLNPHGVASSLAQTARGKSGQ